MFLRILTLLLSFAIVGHVVAQDTEYDDKPADPFEFDESLKEKWKEQKLKIPDFPKDSNLLGIDLGGGDDPYEYQIDMKALDSGEDGVVRYTVVISSPSGASNVMYEGINCSTSSYKTYAYGSQEKFISARNPRWKPIRSYGRVIFRYHLFSAYFCGQHNSLSLTQREIVRRIKYQDEDPSTTDDIF